jgi:hypothetical protein
MRPLTWFRWFVVAGALASGTVRCQTFDPNAIENPCSIHLSRLSGNSTKPISISGERLSLFTEDADAIRRLRTSLAASKLRNLVVYVPVQTGRTMLTLRYEKSLKSGYSERIAKRVPVDFLELQEKLLEADSPSKHSDREELQKTLLPANRDADKGKTVLFRNIAYYGFVPESLGFGGDAAIFTSSDLDRAVASYAALKDTQLDPRNLSVFLGFPDSQEEYDALFKEGRNGELLNWQNRSAEVRDLRDKFGFKLIANQEFKKLSKQKIFRALQSAEGIVWIAAHSHGCFARFPGVGSVEISPEEIAALKLIKHPFVVIRVCNGEENGFAKAFLVAGASAVWVNHGTLKASDANEQVRLFLENARTSTIMNSILAVKAHNEAAKFGSTLHVMNQEEKKSREEYGPAGRE